MGRGRVSVGGGQRRDVSEEGEDGKEVGLW